MQNCYLSEPNKGHTYTLNKSVVLCYSASALVHGSL